MNSKKIQPKNETVELLLSFTKNCETLIHQIHTTPKETLETNLTKPRQTFHSTPPISIEGSWIINLANLEVCNSFFKITENNKFEFYTQPRDSEFSFTELKDKVAEALGLLNTSIEDLEHEPDNSKTYRKLSIEMRQTDGYHTRLLRSSQPPFRDLESYLRILTGPNEDDVQVIL